MRLLLLAVLVGCIGPAPWGEDTVRFLAVGDTGTGDRAQAQVAHAMEATCRQRGCDFVLMLGDNFYPAGVSGPSDPQLQTKFEDVYGLEVPFYPVLGNHDYGQEYNSSWRAQAQVDYAGWSMPDRTYAFDHGPARFIALDSGPVSIHGTPEQTDAAAIREQQDFLRGALTNATWTVAFAHHPYRSNGIHGDAGRFDATPGKGQAWNDLIESSCQDIDLYLAGHDHDLQWLEPVAACPDTQLIISGAGAKTRDQGTNDHPARFQAFDTLGFAWIEATPDTLTVVVYDQLGRVLHEGQADS